MSRAKPLAVSYRRLRSLLSAFSTIQSSSPLTNRPSFTGSICRLAATLGALSAVLSRELGVGASCSRISFSNSSKAAFFSVSRVIGVVPVRSSYRITPRAYTSARVSTSKALKLACSGAMYSGVPITLPNAVNSDCSVSCKPVVAFARPKSITFGTGLPSWLSTRMFDGFKSRWMIPFWCACCTALQICVNRLSRS